MQQKPPAKVNSNRPGTTIALKFWVRPKPLDPRAVGLLEPGFLHACRVVRQYCCASNKKDGLPQPSHARSAATPMAAIQGLCIELNLFVAVATEPAWDCRRTMLQGLAPKPDRLIGMVEGAFQPQWVNWVIRLTSPHLPYLGQAATGAA